MNKALHALVYVFVVLAGAALFFEIQLNAKRTELTDRNKLQEDYLVKIAKTIEESGPEKGEALEAQKDDEAVEAKIIDIPNTKNMLEDYSAFLEQQNLKTYEWNDAGRVARSQLRAIYKLDDEGKPELDAGEPLQTGPGTADELLSKLLDSAKNQQSRLNTTRAALTDLRGKLESVIAELNKLKPEARQDKVTIEEQKAKIAKLEEEKADLENQITKKNAEIEELNTQITSLKDEVQTAKDETEVAKEEIAKLQKRVEQLNELLKKAVLSSGVKSAAGTAVASLPAGDKGKIVRVDNKSMFAIVEFTDVAMTELKGEDRKNPLPSLELGIRRPGFNGEAGEFVGRLRLRQEVRDKNYVICDVIGAWQQDEAQVNDIVFAD